MNAIAKLLGVSLALFMALATAHAYGQSPSLTSLSAAGLAQEKGDFIQAAELYSKALEDSQLTNDRKGIIYTDRGVVHARLGKSRQAIEDFNTAIQLFPEYASAYNNRGCVLLSLGFTEDARKDFERAIVLAPGYVAALNNRASVHAMTDKLGLAIEDYTEAVKAAPSESAPLGGRARVKIAQRRPFAAMRDLNRALLNDNRFVVGYRLRGQVHADLEDYASAAEDLSRAIAFDPDNASAYLARGRIYLNARKIQAAEKDFSKVVELRPTSPTAYRERGHVNVLLDNFEQAEQDLARSQALNPGAGSTFAYRALMYKKKGQPELGAQEISQALRLTPEDPIVLWAKGEIDEALSRMDEAAESYRQSLEQDYKLKNAQFGLARLGEAPFRKVERIEKLAFGPWSVTREFGSYFTQHKDFPKLRVPLEMVSEGEPEIMSWEKKSDEFKGIGVLTFSAGKAETRNGQVAVEYTAIINMNKQALVDLVPSRIGALKSKWTWQDGRVLIDGVDGLDTQHILHSNRDRGSVVASQRRNAGRANSSPSRRTSKTHKVKRKKPKTLLDMLFGN